MEESPVGDSCFPGGNSSSRSSRDWDLPSGEPPVGASRVLLEFLADPVGEELESRQEERHRVGAGLGLQEKGEMGMSTTVGGGAGSILVTLGWVEKLGPLWRTLGWMEKLGPLW